MKNTTLARNICHDYLHLMAIVQQTDLEQFCIGFERHWDNFVASNLSSLKGEPELYRQCRMLLNPRYAANVIQSSISEDSPFWVSAGNLINLRSRELNRLLYQVRNTDRNNVVPNSVLCGFSETWKGVVAEAVIWNRGAGRVRSAPQAKFYDTSRDKLHRLKAETYYMRTQVARWKKRAA
ncbi:MAG: hypothetical protein AAGA50_29985 [Pseudomonadota bacterium]